MRKSIQIIATSFAILLGNFGFSQLDSVYVVKNGFVTHAIKQSDVDSIIFYRPVTPITDIDGNVYTSVTIGTQEWMSENLRTTKYSDGTAIPNVTGNDEWGGLTTGAWCNFLNDNQYDTIYGKLYNWYAVETGKLCPTGWHVPTHAEWTVLSDYLVADGHDLSEVGKALKSTTGWMAETGESANGTDDYGWNGLASGIRIDNGWFQQINHDTYWWSSTETGYYAWWCRLNGTYDVFYIDFWLEKVEGLSVRCIKD